MVKSYLRYVGDEPFGVIAAPNANVCIHHNGAWAITPALQDIHIYHLQQGTLLHTLSYTPTSSSSPLPCVRVLTLHPLNPHVLAAGYDDGSIRLFSLTTFATTTTLHGHTSAVTALVFNGTGALLFSASLDTAVVCWDVVAERGVVRLKGHRDAVTGLALLENAELGHAHLVSASKDGTVKVWSLPSQHCTQTLVVDKEVWALAVDKAESCVITGGTEDALKLFRIRALPPSVLPKRKAPSISSDSADDDLLQPWGSLPRQSVRRVTSVMYAPDEKMVLVLSADKVADVFVVRGPEYAEKRRKRRRKREKRERAEHQAEGEVEKKETEEAIDDERSTDDARVDDHFTPLPVLRCDKRIVSAHFAPPPQQKRSSAALNASHRLLVSLADNSLTYYGLQLSALLSSTANSSEEEPYSALSTLELAGHRTPIRTLSLSSDGAMLLTASSEQVKVWNTASRLCIRTLSSGHALCSLFVPGNAHVVVGTKEGDVEWYDVNSARCLGKVKAHDGGSVYCMQLRPDGRGFATGGGDKQVKAWDFTLEEEPPSSPSPTPRPSQRALSIVLARTLTLTDDILCLRHSPNGKYLAVGLLDSTIKLFHADTFLFHLSLYGHRLPVLSVDFSSDSALLASGSADKNLKVWGVAFGDCHCSLFAHADSVTTVRWARGTHYVVSAGKDGAVKLWDADAREMVQEMRGHTSEVWTVDVTGQGGELIASAGNDRSVRLWRQGEDLIFLEEEREKRREEAAAADGKGRTTMGRLGDTEGVGERVEVEGEMVTGGANPETLQGGERLMEAIDMAEAERKRVDAHAAAEHKDHTGGADPLPSGGLAHALQLMAADRASKEGREAAPLAVNPFMQGMSPVGFVLSVLSALPLPSLDDCLLMLPFSYALRLLSLLCEALEREEGRVETVVHAALLLVAVHERQIVASRSHIGELKRLRKDVRATLRQLKDRYGTNRATLRLLQQRADEHKGRGTFG